VGGRDLTAIAARLPTGQESFFRTVEVSVKALAPEVQTRYKALAVLLEDMAAPLPILETLWGVHDAEALRTSRYLVERSLAFRDGDTGSIRVHDLQLDYVRVLHPDQKVLDLLHAALRLSSHVIARDPTQFASQMVGRLLPYVQPITAVQHFTSSVVRRLIGWFPGTPGAQPPYRGALRLIHVALWLHSLVVAES
jgi:hypothetical protein